MNVSTAAPSLAAQIANLPKLAMTDLWDIWDKYFPRRPPHNNRAYVEGRVAYKIQEEALGTKLVVQTQMARIGEAQSRIKTQRGVEVQVVPGTVLVREFDNREHRVISVASKVVRPSQRIGVQGGRSIPFGRPTTRVSEG